MDRGRGIDEHTRRTSKTGIAQGYEGVDDERRW
jgi:hypothetical protein